MVVAGGGRAFGPDQRQALDSLINCWSNWDLSHDYYITVLIPQIVSTAHFEGATDRELAAIASIREALDDEQWSNLEALIEERRPSIERRKAERKAEAAEAARLAREQATRLEQLAQQQAAIAAEEERQVAAALAEQARWQAAATKAENARRADINRLRKDLLLRLDDKIEHDYMHAEDWLSANDEQGLVPHDELREHQAAFVREWSRRALGLPLDPEQALAVSAVGHHTKVAARAGSGKTRTLEARALFLMLHCRVPPDQIMLLAFNNAAALELQQRIESRLHGLDGPYCMTFHALAYRLVRPSSSLLSDKGDLDRSQSRRVQECIDTLLRSPLHLLKLRKLMLSYYKDDWKRIIRRGDHLPPAEAMEARRHLVRETMAGEYVKSHGERVIANLLIEHGVEYQYERLHDWNGRHYRPDFSILVDRRVVAVIEYFGMRGDQTYDRQTVKKIEYWSRRRDVHFIPLYREDLSEQRWPETQANLIDALRGLGPAFLRRSDEEIWKEVKQRAIYGFTAAAKTLVDRARQRGWDAAALRREGAAMNAEHPAAELFVELGSIILQNYERSLAENGEEDFAGLMWQAVRQMSGEPPRSFRRPGFVAQPVGVSRFLAA